MSYKKWLERDILIKEEELNLLKEQLSIILDIEKKEFHISHRIPSQKINNKKVKNNV